MHCTCMKHNSLPHPAPFCLREALPFPTGITGNVSIDGNGDRQADYSLLDMDPETGNFEVRINTRHSVCSMFDAFSDQYPAAKLWKSSYSFLALFLDYSLLALFCVTHYLFPIHFVGYCAACASLLQIDASHGSLRAFLD